MLIIFELHSNGYSGQILDYLIYDIWAYLLLSPRLQR